MLRNQIKKGGARVVLWLTLFSLVAGSLFTFVGFSRKFSGTSIATVNGLDIGAMEFRRKYAEVLHSIQQIRQMYGPQAEMVLKMYGLDSKPEEFVQESLITEKVMQSAADQLGAEVSKEYVQTKLRDPLFVREYLGNLIPPQAIVGGTLDVVALKYNLQRLGLTETEFEEALYETMKRVLLEHLVTASLYIPQGLVKQAYEQRYLKRKFAVLSVALDDYLKKVPTAQSDADVQAYYESNKAQYRIPEKRSGKQWLFDAANYGILLTDKEIEEAYHKRKRSYIEKPEELDVERIVFPFTEKNKIEVRGKAQEILKQVKEKPDTFAAVAEQYSPTKKKQTLVQGQSNAVLEKIAFGLKKDEISPVIETHEGFEILKLIEKKGPFFKPLEKVKDTLVKALKQEKFMREFNQNGQRVISQAKDLPEVLTKFIAEKGGKLSQLDAVVRDGTPRIAKLFGIQKPGDYAFAEAEGNGYILQLSAITPSVIPPLADIKEKVIQDLRKDKAQKALTADLDAIQAKLKTGVSLEQAAKEIKGSVDKTDWVNPAAPSALDALSAKGLPVDRVLTLVRDHDVLREVTPTHGYLIELTEKEPINEKDFADKKRLVEYQLHQREAQSLLGSVMGSLRNRAKITVNEQLMKQSARV